MDRDALLAAVPENAAFDALPANERKAAVEAFLAAILDAIESDKRQLDAWEARHISGAFGYLAVGWYNAALSAAQDCLLPPQARAPLRPGYEEGVPELQLWRDILDFLRGIPPRG